MDTIHHELIVEALPLTVALLRYVTAGAVSVLFSCTCKSYEAPVLHGGGEHVTGEFPCGRSWCRCIRILLLFLCSCLAPLSVYIYYTIPNIKKQPLIKEISDSFQPTAGGVTNMDIGSSATPGRAGLWVRLPPAGLGFGAGFTRPRNLKPKRRSAHALPASQRRKFQR